MLSPDAFRQLPVFITTMSRWDGDVSSASLALAKVLSQHTRVFYIDYPYTWLDLWRERKQHTVKRRMRALLAGRDFLNAVPGQDEKFKAATPRAVLPVYSLPDGALYRWVTHRNNRVVANLVKRICKQEGINDFIFLNSFNPQYLADVRQYLNPVLSIYHSRDAIEEVPGHGLNRENECARHYDLVMATAQQLCRNIAQRNQVEVRHFPNGGDVRLFSTAIHPGYSRPAELADIHTPIIGYTGAVCQRIDYSLMVKLAKAFPECTIVIIGPRKDHEFTSIRLDDYPNIRFLGSRKLDQLPAYLQYMDAAIIPFLKNNLTGGIYPLKINEYLAAGRSVVTTNFSEDIQGFSAHIRIAVDHDSFIEQVRLALKENTPALQQQRLEAAGSNSWEHRMKLFWTLAYDAYVARIREQTINPRPHDE